MARVTSRPESFQEPPIDQIARPFQRFFEVEASSGIILLVCTAVALIWANSVWSDSYFELWLTNMTVKIGDVGLSKPLILWINDGLMAIFFLSAWIKREVLIGELASHLWRNLAGRHRFHYVAIYRRSGLWRQPVVEHGQSGYSGCVGFCRGGGLAGSAQQPCTPGAAC